MSSYNDDDWVFDPGLAGINRRIQQEFRQEAEAVEAETRDYEQRLRTLTEWILEARNRGDVLRVQTRQRHFTGTVVYAGRDFLTLQGSDFQADVNLGAVALVTIVEHGRRGGVPLPEGAGTFEMRLLERRGPAPVEIGQALMDDVISGRLMAVGQDHVILETNHREEMVVPFSNITWLVSRRQVR
jgi:hypothetical protein